MKNSNQIRALNDNEKHYKLELIFEPKLKFKIIFLGTAAEKILHQFENPEDHI